MTSRLWSWNWVQDDSFSCNCCMPNYCSMYNFIIWKLCSARKTSNRWTGRVDWCFKEWKRISQVFEHSLRQSFETICGNFCAHNMSNPQAFFIVLHKSPSCIDIGACRSMEWCEESHRFGRRMYILRHVWWCFWQWKLSHSRRLQTYHQLEQWWKQTTGSYGLDLRWWVYLWINGILRWKFLHGQGRRSRLDELSFRSDRIPESGHPHRSWEPRFAQS